MSEDKGILKPRAYARLLTMIGDQLIKNEKIALIELIKNSYDADASWVQIRFNNFIIEKDEDEFKKTKLSSIEIEDDGNGMSFDTIENIWLNPATPNKYILKQEGKNVTTKKNRIIQGEKGIGRFAVYKLGTTVELITRSVVQTEKEIFLINDLSSFDNEIINDGQEQTPKYLDQIEFLFEKREIAIDVVEKNILIRNEKKQRKPHGTLIRITNLRGEWSQAKVDSVLSDVAKLSNYDNTANNNDFICDILVNGETQFKIDKDTAEVLKILQTKAPIKVTNGKYVDDKISYELNGSYTEIALERMLQIKEFRKRFCASDKRSLKRKPECGPFTFQFHIYDISNQAQSKYRLLKDEKDIIRSNRIYLYRDGVRVFPYGDKSDDWLEIDILRGTGRAGDYLSNDQTVGFIGITTTKNPDLKDKTNREGLLEIGNAFEDFKVLIQGILGLLLTEFKKYKISIEQKERVILLKESITQNQFENFKEYLDEKKDSKAIKVFDVIYKNYTNEKKYLKERAEITEDLAAVGITVEAASHDLMMMMQRANSTLGLVSEMVKNKSFDNIKLAENLNKLKGQLDFIGNQIDGIQPIFRSSKRQIKDIKILSVINNVKKYYDSVVEDNEIEISSLEKGKNLVIQCTEAVLLQTFINLIDNSTYWLKTIDIPNKQIRIVLDKDNNEVVFADNGPGVKEDNQTYIFEPFFSTKGIQGRGLGLYIAKQLLQRYGFDINYISENDQKILPGANFKIQFNPK